MADCPGCGRPLVSSMGEFWKNPSYSCGRDVPRTECNDSTWLELHCAQGTNELLRAQLAAALRTVEAADKLLGLLIRRLILDGGGRYLLPESEAAAANDHACSRAELARVMGEDTGGAV